MIVLTNQCCCTPPCVCCYPVPKKRITVTYTQLVEVWSYTFTSTGGCSILETLLSSDTYTSVQTYSWSAAALASGGPGYDVTYDWNGETLTLPHGIGGNTGVSGVIYPSSGGACTVPQIDPGTGSAPTDGTSATLAFGATGTTLTTARLSGGSIPWGGATSTTDRPLKCSPVPMMSNIWMDPNEVPNQRTIIATTAQVVFSDGSESDLPQVFADLKDLSQLVNRDFRVGVLTACQVGTNPAPVDCFWSGTPCSGGGGANFIMTSGALLSSDTILAEDPNHRSYRGSASPACGVYYSPGTPCCFPAFIFSDPSAISYWTSGNDYAAGAFVRRPGAVLDTFYRTNNAIINSTVPPETDTTNFRVVTIGSSYRVVDSANYVQLAATTSPDENCVTRCPATFYTATDCVNASTIRLVVPEALDPVGGFSAGTTLRGDGRCFSISALGSPSSYSSTIVLASATTYTDCDDCLNHYRLTPCEESANGPGATTVDVKTNDVIADGAVLFVDLGVGDACYTSVENPTGTAALPGDYTIIMSCADSQCPKVYTLTPCDGQEDTTTRVVWTYDTLSGASTIRTTILGRPSPSCYTPSHTPSSTAVDGQLPAYSTLFSCEDSECAGTSTGGAFKFNTSVNIYDTYSTAGTLPNVGDCYSWVDMFGFTNFATVVQVWPGDTTAGGSCTGVPCPDFSTAPAGSWNSTPQFVTFDDGHDYYNFPGTPVVGDWYDIVYTGIPEGCHQITAVGNKTYCAATSIRNGDPMVTTFTGPFGSSSCT